MSDVDAILNSDGGGDVGSSAGAACIIEEKGSGKRRHLVAFLGGATNNEAEIIGALLGFSFLYARTKAATEPASKKKQRIHWIADSEYTLKSATQYSKVWQLNGWRTSQKKAVKNQSLWRSFLHLTASFSLHPEHTRGHAGHPENEACDTACTWAREYALAVLRTEGEGAYVRIGGDAGDSLWLVLDGRQFVRRMRDAEGSSLEAEDMELLAESLLGLGAVDFDGPQPDSSTGAEHADEAGERDQDAKGSEEWKRALTALTVFSGKLESHAKKDERFKNLFKDLTKLIKKHQKLK